MQNKIYALITSVVMLLIINGCQKNGQGPTIKPVAKAPGDTTITLPVNSLALSGSGTDSSGDIVGYLWSQVSGPNEAAFVNEGSPNVTIKGLVQGKYVFQFAVTDNKGLTGVATFSVTVMPEQTVTLSLSPANNPTEVALAVVGSGDATNRTSIEEPLSAWTIGGIPFYVRDLLKFNLTSIPANATILKADLYLYSDTIPKNGDLVHANYGADNSFLVQQIATDWDSSTVNWFSQPDGLTANQVVVPSTTEPYLNVDIDVKDLISAMVAGNANYGFKLSLQNEFIYTSRIFCSSFYNVTSRHPKLVVKYAKHI
jgi:hypothetical protein